jgi:DNA-binding winged helix-turn-helix (wHTH) protein/Flp pilus assembly protein TadD
MDPVIETYRFGPFELDPRSAELRREGELVPLQLQPARILLLLVERAGELVAREEIRALVWPDRVVDYEHGLNYAIRQIRAALGDDADSPAYIETLPRRGYRFTAGVRRETARSEVAAPRRRVLGYALAGLVAVAAVVVFAGLNGDLAVAPGVPDTLRASEPPMLPKDPAAREAYLIGRGLLPSRNREDLERARREFERVLELEPDQAGALVGLGEALLRMGRGGEARRPLERSLELAPDDPQAHHLLAQVLLFHSWEWDAAERHFDRAIRLRPGYAAGYQVRAYWLALTGRMEEALAAMTTALRLDPLSSYVQADAGWINYWAGHLEEAVARCERTLELDPESGSAKTCLLFARIAQGNAAAEREAARALMVSHGATPADLASLDAVPVEAGLGRYWTWEVDRLEALAERSPQDAFLLALASAQLGRNDTAFRELEAARRGRTSWMLWLEVEPRLAPLRKDPRWPALVRRMGYPPSKSG